MKLYYSPGACSLAPHILIHEAGLKCDLAQVDLKNKTVDGGDYTKINPKGYVPTLQLDNGEILTEAQVILQYIADQRPETELLPKPSDPGRYHAQEWLAYIASEIHKGFGPLWSDQTPAEVKEATKALLARKFDFLSERIEGGYVTGTNFTAADPYLFTVLNWTKIHGIEMDRWPRLGNFQRRIGERPATRVAMKEEGLLK